MLPVETLVKKRQTRSFSFSMTPRIKRALVEVGFNDGTNVEIVAGVKPVDLADCARPASRARRPIGEGHGRKLGQGGGGKRKNRETSGNDSSPE